MTVRSSARTLATSPESEVERLAQQMVFQNGRRVSPAERRSWERSLPVLARDLIDAGLPNVEVILEYQLPLTSQRADVVLAGVHPRTGRPSYVVVELKQWTRARLWEGDANLVEVPDMPGGPKLHPSRQVQNYCEYIVDFARTLQGDEDAVAGVAYLHNATAPTGIADLFFHDANTRVQMFSGSDRARFHAFLRSRLSNEPGQAAADALLRSPAAPSRQLLAVAADEVQRREQFVLQDNQQLAVDLVRHRVRRAREADTKAIVIVSGGPGSGKSVVALSLMGELAREGWTVIHATGSRSFTQTLRKVAGQRNSRVQKMFKYFNSFMDASPNSIDVLVLDEAHRIRETSVNRYTRAQYRTGRAQLDELVSTARVPVFLLDQNQIVRPGEIGSVEEIRQYAADRGLPVDEIELAEQFRCGGSLAYVRWVEGLLGLSASAPEAWAGDERFEVLVADSPEELEALTLGRATAGDLVGRVTAGYCWPWSDPRQDDTLVDDVVIDGWSRPWNVKGDRRVGAAPPAALWSSDPGGVGQVGCVYTAQGFEYDWNGVIIGPDLVWRDGRFVSDRSANKDPDFRNRNTVPDERFDALVRNVYKVLLTRGMVGTVIYSTDAQTRHALRTLIAAR